MSIVHLISLLAVIGAAEESASRSSGAVSPPAVSIQVASRDEPLLGSAPSEARSKVADAEHGSANDSLAEQFLHPPEEAKPWVYWFWMNGSITREGITADLEAMRRIGVGGALIMNITAVMPEGPVTFMGLQWRSLFRHAVSEANRLGLELTMNNDDGFSGSGGPWIKPDEAMQQVVRTVTEVEGPNHLEMQLPQPTTMLDFYRDIALLAVPIPPAENPESDLVPVAVTSDVKQLKWDRLFDLDPATRVTLPPARRGQSHLIDVQLREAMTVRAVTFDLSGFRYRLATTYPSELQVSDDGSEYRTVCNYDLNWNVPEVCPTITIGFAATSSRFFRIKIANTAALTLAGLTLTNTPHVNYWQTKAGFAQKREHGGETHALALNRGSWTSWDLPAASVIASRNVVDLTGKMDRNGRLVWQVPPGRWSLLRIGHTPTGKRNHPATPEGEGLECDKLNRRGIEAHFSHVLGQLVRDAGALVGPTLKIGHSDSWELFHQNWSPGFRDEFRQRRGYDLLPYLPVLTTGQVVDGAGVSDRFLWDVRRTIADLIRDNYHARLQQLCHEHGLLYSSEGAGRQQYLYDPINYQSRSDLPMGEFWVNELRPRVDCRTAASAAHLYGQTIVGAEAYTSAKSTSTWRNDPFSLKKLGDWSFAVGVNRLVIHRYLHQPWLDKFPGMDWGMAGINLDRNTTWWEQGGAWMSYLARCQYMLQRGRFVADLCYYLGEDVPTMLPFREQVRPAVPDGYQFDACNAEVIIDKMSVEDGRIVLPNGPSYRALVLPECDEMGVTVLAKIERLIHAGATVIGPRPVRAPGLQGYPQCDVDVKRIGEQVWAGVDGRKVTSHKWGQGRVVYGKPLNGVLEQLHVPPDFEYQAIPDTTKLLYVHRKTQDADIYFVSNQSKHAARAECVFRVGGKVPELWYPDSGKIAQQVVFESKQHQTALPVDLAPFGSVVVVFRKPLRSPCIASVQRNGQMICEPSVDVDLLRSEVAESNDSAKTLQDSDNKIHDVLGQPSILLEGKDATTLLATVHQSGHYVLRPNRGASIEITVDQVPPAFSVHGPWEVHFPPGWNAPDRITLTQLASWTQDSRPGVKYFSGTAKYLKEIELPVGLVGGDRRLFLDLGQVYNLARVTVNGADLGVLWKPPFSVEITDAVNIGTNHLEIAVTNLWPNRLIGDEQYPDDCSWVPHGVNGFRLESWPEWLLNGTQRPEPRRLTFTTWKHFAKGSPLLPSGLLGPVQIRSAVTCEVRLH